MRTFSICGLAVAASLVVSSARAEDTPTAPPASNSPPDGAAPGVVGTTPAAVPSLPQPGWQTSDSAWFNRYTFARERLLAGDFAIAEQLFAAAAATATSAADRAIALELGALAKNWAVRDLVFARRIDMGESNAPAKAIGERTTDEVAVLYTAAVIYGLGSGAWIDVMTEPETAAGLILPALGLAGAAAGAVAAVDGTKRLRYGVPQSIVSGMYIGLEEGIALSLWNQARVARADEWSGKGVASVVWGFATAGAGAGAIVGSVGGTTPGRASFVGSAAMWSGAVAGMLAGAVSPTDETQDDNALLAAVIGLNAGAVAGVLAAGPVSPSIARVRFLDLGGIAGGLVAGGLYLSVTNRESTAGGLLGLTALGIGGGLTTAWFATAKMEPDRLAVETASAQPSPPSNLLATTTVSFAPMPGGAALSLRGVF